MGVTEFGTKYNQVINVAGEDGRTVPVKVASLGTFTVNPDQLEKIEGIDRKIAAAE